MGRSRPKIKVVKFPRLGYHALPSQRRFHESTARFKGFSGPIGSGKSRALCQEALNLTYINRGRLGLIGAPTYPMLRDATQTALFDILEGYGVKYEFNKGENTLRMEESGSKIIFRPLDEFERLRGTNLAWFGLDEMTYTPEAAWLRLEGRLRDPQATRLCGFGVWTPKGFDWVYQKFVAEAKPGYTAVIAEPFENSYLLGKVPDFYERLRTSYDEAFYEQEVLGQYRSMQGGLVYGGFNRREHVQTLSVKMGRPLLWALDFNVDPMCSVVAQSDGESVLVLDEISIGHASTLEACEEFARRYPRHDAGVVVYGDASGNNQKTSGTSDYQIIREFFRTHYSARVTYKVPKGNPGVRDRVMLVNSKLRDASGEARLLVDSKCKELIKDFEQVSYRPESTAIDKEKDHRRTHLSDALGYLLWQECKPQAGIGNRRSG